MDGNLKKTVIVSIYTSIITVLVLAGLAGVYIVRTEGSLNTVFIMPGEDSIAVDSIAEESRIIDIVAKADPAVVSIVITKNVPIIEQYYEDVNPFGADVFDNFFGRGFGFRIPQYKERGTERREVGGGSGFFASADGYVVTNKHVVDDDKAEYTVLANDGKKYAAKVLAKDSALDMAILKVKGNGFPYLAFGNSDALKPGQTVIAIGNALAEFRNSVSVGVVSGLSRSIVAGDSFGKSEYLEGVIQTDAAINPGNSGGPLLDLRGTVIGINIAVQRGAENIGFALPSNAVKTIVDSVREHGEIIRSYLGVRYAQITETVKKKNNIAVDYGVLVARGETSDDLAVVPGSPADKAGIAENDIILAIDGIKLTQGKSLTSIIRQKKPGQTVRLKIIHKSREKEILVKLEKAPKDL